MVDLQPTPFTTSQPAIVTFDFEDIASGIGFDSFFAMVTNLAAGNEFILTDRAQFSGKITTSRAGAGTQTLTFTSVPFSRAKFATGTAVFSCGLGVNGNVNVTVAAQLQKWDGSNATNMSSEITSDAWVSGGVAGTMRLLQLPLTDTNITEGESLRLIVKFTPDSAVITAIGHDPMGRSENQVGTDESTSIMRLDVPFRREV